MHPLITKLGTPLALLSLAGCAAPLGLLSQTPTTVESLEGNYRTLAACTFEQLSQRQPRLRRTDVADRSTVRIRPDTGEWELSFVDDGAGKLTRAEMKSPGTQASDYALAIARACAA
jgi:hypothetical protein